MKPRIGLIVDPPIKKLSMEEKLHADSQKQKTAESIYRILKEKYEVELVFADNIIFDVLDQKNIDIAFNLSSGIKGESRQSQIPALLEMVGIPYVGSGVLSHALALNKAVAKKIFTYHNIPTPRFEIINSEDDINKYYNLKFPVIVKPACEGSGFGIYKDSVVKDYDSMTNKVSTLLKQYQPPALIEEFIEGKEYTVGIVGNGNTKRVLPILEIDFDEIPEDVGKFYSFQVKTYYSDKTKYHCPANLNKEMERKIGEVAKSAFEALGCYDLARVDIRVRGEEIYVLEINSLPGLLPVYSDLPKMAEAGSMSYEELINYIFDEALNRIKRCKEKLA